MNFEYIIGLIDIFAISSFKSALMCDEISIWI